jgi:hypothetical protein
MLLTLQEAQQFFELHWSLTFLVNQQLNVLSDKIETANDYARQPPEALSSHPFVARLGDGLDACDHHLSQWDGHV